MDHVDDSTLSAQRGDDDDFKMRMMQVMVLHDWSATVIRCATARHFPTAAQA